MTRRFRQTPRAIARLTGLPLTDVLDMIESGHRFGPLHAEPREHDPRHPWDPHQRETEPGGVRIDSGYSLDPADEPHDFGRIRAEIDETARRADARHFSHTFTPGPDTWDGKRYRCRLCGRTREEH